MTRPSELVPPWRHDYNFRRARLTMGSDTQIMQTAFGSCPARTCLL